MRVDFVVYLYEPMLYLYESAGHCANHRLESVVRILNLDCYSQYPGEKEITFPPFTCLEADGDPRVEHVNNNELIIFPLKVCASRIAVPRPQPLTHHVTRVG